MGNEHFANIAKQLVCRWKNDNLREREETVSTSDVYVVWIAKVLQNNKAMLATNHADGLYFEVTYNGDKEEFYLDAYRKAENLKYVRGEWEGGRKE